MKRSKARRAPVRKPVKKAASAGGGKTHGYSGRKAMRVGVLSAALSNAHLRQKLIDVAGENALHVIKGFRKNMSDDELARKTKLKVSDVRVVLNKLHSCGLAKYYRNRDKDSGWYSYVWCFEESRLGEFVRDRANGGGAESMVDGDKYFCGSCGAESMVGFEEASSALFRCLHCGGSLEFVEKR